MRFSVRLLTCALLVAAAAVAQNTDVDFRWALVAAPNAGKGDLVPVTDRIALQTGDELAILLEPKCECFAYVFFESAGKELRLLVPSRVDDLDYPVEPDRAISIPAFPYTEQAGESTMHLIVSATKLAGLGRLLQKYVASAPSDKPAASAAVLAEIRRVKQSRIAARAVERPVSIAGRIRGGKDLSRFAVQISGTDFYSRTFAIEHR